MGEVIRASAAADDIFKDTRTTLSNAVAKGGAAKEKAEMGLGAVLAMIKTIDAELTDAREVLTPLRAELNAENDRADAALNRIYDEIWNDVGRPANDRHLALMFPGGAAYYTEGDTVGQPTRMELLARLFDRKLHPKLTEEQSAAYATRVREAAAALQADLDASAGPAANVALLDRVRTALARTAQFELANLKRTYKSAGMSETAIHEIIPDRPVAKKASKKAAPPPPAAPPVPPTPVEPA